MTRYSTSRGLLYTAPPKTDRRSQTTDEEPTTAVDPAAPTAAPADD